MTDEQLQAIRAAYDALVEFIRDAWDALAEAMQKVYNWFHDRYTEAGAIYGDTHDGMRRWYGELAMVARLRQEAASIERRHRMLADIRSVRLCVKL